VTHALTRQYAKLCEIEDFADARIVGRIAEILPERDPLAHIERKAWEFAMLTLVLEDLGRLGRDTTALAVGAGTERIAFWLANRVGKVVATDIYGASDFGRQEAPASMLADPAAHAPYPYDADSLDVRFMDARELQFEDASFDVVYSLSSIEHFGSPRDKAQAAGELGRVLRPGGHAVVITECFVRRHPLNAAPVDFAIRLATAGRKRRVATPRRRGYLDEPFTAAELQRLIVAPSGLELMQPLDLGVSAQTWTNLTRQVEGRVAESRAGTFYPHILLQVDRSVFTSVCLPLRKPGG
jgi:SAM-dependent methyltransferase